MMKKYNWCEERKKALPPAEKQQPAPEETASPVQESVPEENTSAPQGKPKGRFSKFALLAGRIAIFVCPAFSVANTLIQYFRPFPVIQSGSTKIDPKLTPVVRIGGTQMTLPPAKAQELSAAFRTLVVRKENDRNLFSSAAALQTSDLKIKSSEDLRKMLGQESFHGTEKAFTVEPKYFCIAPTYKKFAEMSIGGMIPQKITYKVYQASQYIAKVKVFASAALILTDAEGNIRFIRCNFSKEAEKLLNVKAQLMPSSLEKELQKQAAGKITSKEDVIFDPALVLQKGKLCLAWKVILTLPGDKKVCLIVDQTNKKVVFRYEMKQAES